MHNGNMITANKIASQKKPRKLKSWADHEIVFPICELRRCREDLGLTVRDVERCGVSKATIHRAEQGFELHLSHALALAAFYEKPIEEIWGKWASRKGTAK